MNRDYVNKNIKILMISLLCSLAFISVNAHQRNTKNQINTLNNINISYKNKQTEKMNIIIKNLEDAANKVMDVYFKSFSDNKNTKGKA